jgi:hypothetical protein
VRFNDCLAVDGLLRTGSEHEAKTDGEKYKREETKSLHGMLLGDMGEMLAKVVAPAVI